MRRRFPRWPVARTDGPGARTGGPISRTDGPISRTGGPVAATFALAVALLALTGTPAGAATPHASLPQIEPQVMCVTCKIPLNVANSEQANRERALIRELIARGEDEAQIKQTLVAEYGPSVLGLPRARGFDLAVYLVPIAVVLALVGLLLLLIPRWRAQARAQAAARSAASTGGVTALGPDDAARLERDLARFD